MWEDEGALGMMMAAAAVVDMAGAEGAATAGTAARQTAAGGRKEKEHRKKERKGKWKGGYAARLKTIRRGRTGRARTWAAAEQMLRLAGGDAAGEAAGQMLRLAGGDVTGGGQEEDTGKGSKPQKRGKGMVTKGDMGSTRAIALLLYMGRKGERRAGRGAAEATSDGGDSTPAARARSCSSAAAA